MSSLYTAGVENIKNYKGIDMFSISATYYMKYYANPIL
jgi:hypothetical protein